ncbi:MAG: PucR family transcriptional regulator, partial [Actinomycetota bacterium]|nr:PucR family transcriptional regulator [Actinomycetota bacterium]
MAERSARALARRLDKSVGTLAAAAVARMERDLAWFRDLSAADRSWIG